MPLVHAHSTALDVDAYTADVYMGQFAPGKDVVFAISSIWSMDYGSGNISIRMDLYKSSVLYETLTFTTTKNSLYQRFQPEETVVIVYRPHAGISTGVGLRTALASQAMAA